MKAEFYMLYLKPKPGISVSNEKLQKQLNRALDWFHLPPYTWVLYSTANPAEWSKRLALFFKPNGYMFIGKLDVSAGNRSGWMSKQFWKWLRDNIRQSDAG